MFIDLGVTMKVFISWSGDQSKAIADAIRRWLPGVLQAVRPYFSPDDVAKGARWEGEIAKELEASRIGLLVLTPHNIEAPWLLFEAGALAKNLAKSKVCPLLFGLDPAEIKGPLVQFQAAKFDMAEMKRVVKMINLELGDSGLSNDVLDQVFDMWWPKLNSTIDGIVKKMDMEDQPEEKTRTERDILEEILAISRSNISRPGFSEERGFASAALDDLVFSYKDLIDRLGGAPPSVLRSANRLLTPIRYVASRGPNRRATRSLLSDISQRMELMLADSPKIEIDEEKQD